MPTAFDITSRKHGGNVNSEEAFKRASMTAESRRDAIWHALLRFPLGLTAKELAAHLDVPLHALSGRVSELRAAGRVGATGERRDGGAVVIALRAQGELGLTA